MNTFTKYLKKWGIRFTENDTMIKVYIDNEEEYITVVNLAIELYIKFFKFETTENNKATLYIRKGDKINEKKI